MTAWKSDSSPYLSHTVRGPFYLSSRRHPPGSPRRLSSLLTRRLSRGAVQPKQGPNSETVQDDSPRRDVLFPVYIHLASHVLDVSRICKYECSVVMLYPLSAARLDIYSLKSKLSLPCELTPGPVFVLSFTGYFFLHAIVEPPCMSGDPFASEIIGSESRLRYYSR